MFEWAPIRMEWTSPRTTAFIHTLAWSPSSTSPITCADWSTYTRSPTFGQIPLYGRIIRGLRKRASLSAPSRRRQTLRRARPLRDRPAVGRASRAQEVVVARPGHDLQMLVAHRGREQRAAVLDGDDVVTVAMYHEHGTGEPLDPVAGRVDV